MFGDCPGRACVEPFRPARRTGMKPLSVESENVQEILNIGRASVQIVHDVKNQLNGLKLYATFLRKRMEKHESPADEQETVLKLIAGLERAAADMTTLVRYGRPFEPRLRPDVNLTRLVRSAFENSAVEMTGEESEFAGSFDAEALGEALRIVAGRGVSAAGVSLRKVGGGENESPRAFVEWRSGFAASANDDADPFRSFAGGEGLRMALAAKIIEAHRGTAERLSEDDGGGAKGAGGANLRITLPLA